MLIATDNWRTFSLFSCVVSRLLSGYPFVNVSHTHTHRHLGFSFSVLLSLFFVLFSTVGGQSGKCVASYRAGKNARTSFLASARQRPWQTLKSALPNIIAAGFEETMDVCFAHALSLNFFTPSRTSQHTAKKISTFSSIDKRRLANGESFFSHPIYLLTWLLDPAFFIL